MKKTLFLLFVLAALAFSTTQTYMQKVDLTGASTIEETRDMSIFLQLLPPDSLKKIYEECKADPSLSCDVNGTYITMKVTILPNNQYYTITTDNGFLSTTTFSLNKVPNDLFDASINKILNKAGLVNSTGSVTAIDLNDKEANKARAAALKEAGITIDYTITTSSGKTQSFDLVEVFSDSTPLIVQDIGLNFWLLSLIVGVIVIGALAYGFFGGKKEGKKTKKK